ncbi:uncharacterized protein LOC131168227 isoform X3 [Malania oleifera]|uniref:uncharacterized protein LOC131168227 isoform X3 n=1 Tax=Malania oleifera TaxID=397392 RepID=UPI0025ADCDD1|nr:uncharacterized protein LOC131168227 isoform X3 [Malania oleifera]
MRFKRQKRHRKTVKFYTTCFGFREPFKVLCDGTFLHHLVANHIRITPPNDAVSSLLGAKTKLFTTRCVLTELKSLGDSHSESLKLAHNLTTARCDHERRKSAVACIMEIIGEKNPEHFFVATMDAELRKKLQEVPGVPVMFGLRKALLLEQPSAFQRQFVASSEEGRLHMTELEYDMLKRRTKNRQVSQESMDSSDADEGLGDPMSEIDAVRKTNTTRKRMGEKDKVQFKRKRAKGPNPLSCLKKKTHGKPQPNVVPMKEGIDSNKTGRSRTRKRKRSRGGRKSEEADH